MGIQVEFNSALALRNISEASAGRREQNECIWNDLEVDAIYPFLKEGQRLYWLEGEIPLVETRGNQQLSRPKASIRIIKVTHFVGKSYKVWTRGTFKVVEIFTDDAVHFEGFKRVPRGGEP